jgi:VanZ family protein
MLHKLVAIAAWASLAFIAYATLSPIQARPKISSADLEHIVAFAVTGLLFCLAYPRQIVRICFIVLGSAVLLEYLQKLTPDRHGTLLDAFEKLVGGALGIFAARATLSLWRRKRSPQSQSTIFRAGVCTPLPSRQKTGGSAGCRHAEGKKNCRRT